VILLALSLVLGITAAYLHRQEVVTAKRELEQVARTVAVSTLFNFLSRSAGGTVVLRQIESIDAQADELDVRILVINRSGKVLYDTDTGSSLNDQTLEGFATPIQNLLDRAAATGDVVQRWLQPDGAGNPLADQNVLVTANGRYRPNTIVAMVAPPRRAPLVRMYLPRLLTFTAISLAVASIAGLVIARRISEPIHRLTDAADKMSQGDLDQQVPGEGEDELGRLVGSFNTMSDRVAAMYRSQRDLLANVAHELRTPLTSVQGYTQGLSDNVFTSEDERSGAYRTIQREADRMRSLIDQLLDLARLESGQASLRIETVNLAALFDRLNEIYAPRAAQKSIDLSFDAAGDSLQADESRLMRVLNNLIGNALRHTPSGGRIRVASLKTAGGVRLLVSDTGEGIEQTRISRIFERFDRGDRDDKTGFGLGLAIARELVELHGGTISVVSELGIGTTFAIDFPVVTELRNGGRSG
jgi:signal transduction histidine kinase